MKYLVLIPLLFVASCASRPQLALRPAPPASVTSVESVRFAALITSVVGLIQIILK